MNEPAEKAPLRPEGDIVLEIEETVTIVQPTERAWALVVDETNDPLWQETLIDVLEGRLRGVTAGS